MRLGLLLILSALTLLAGCSSHSPLPDFTASGWLADSGTVRIWRKNQRNFVHIQTLYTPFTGGASEKTDYIWLYEKLISVERHSEGGKPDDIRLRFDSSGNLSFMQRQLAGHREPLSDDEVALYQFEAQRILKTSDALLDGRVRLHQGRWQEEGMLISCQKVPARPAFDDYARQIILQLQRNSPSPVSVAWLEAPEGAQLLLVTRDDLCASEPQESNF